MKLVLLALVIMLLASCGSTKKIDKDRISKVKTVAVVVYSVPQRIEFKEDPRGQKSGTSLTDVVKMIAKEASVGDGVKASDKALKEFIHTANTSQLPFKFVSYDDMKKNKKFVDLGSYRAPAPAKKEESGFSSFMTTVASYTGGGQPLCAGPEYLQNFGLVNNWWDGKASTGTSDEAEYIKKSIEALGVDAVLIINDPGFSFSCEACVGGTGSASTGSAFTVTLIDKEGKELLNLRQWFGTSPGSAAIVAGAVNPLQQDKLFAQHGIKTANLFVEEFSDALNKK
ncbi:MAG: hypothetical protein HYV97_18220 [Bdellovibrio sp.]|nr:hypothetical protein [Bdellovibrio sp.]